MISLLCLLQVRPALAQAPAGDALCRAADPTSTRMVEELRRILSSTDSAEVELRTSARIIYQPTATVEYVTDEPVCELAIRALNGRAKTPGRGRQVYVYNLGSQYAVDVREPGVPGGIESVGRGCGAGRADPGGVTCRTALRRR